MQDAVLTSWEDEKPFYDSLGALVSNPLENAEIIRIMDAQYKKSHGELSNLTRTTMEQSQRDLINILESTGYDIDPGTGAGKVVNPLGLHGYNCRHSHKPWDIRLRNPYVDENGNLKIDNEENKRQYELMQKQRAMERNIRKTKRFLAVKQEQIDSVAETDVKSILQDDYDKLAADLARQNQAYNDFCKNNNLQPQYDRIKAAGFSRQQEKTAREGVKRYQKVAQNDGKAVNQNAVEQKGEVGYNISRGRDELQKTAQEIRADIGNYANKPSKWSGNIVVDNSLTSRNVLGQKEWNCDITLIDTADNGTIWHEMLHSCSVSYYDKDIFVKNRRIEEASVEFLKRQICKERKIVSVLSYEGLPDILEELNKTFEYGTDMEFAIELFNIPLPERYKWLEDKVDTSLRINGASFEYFNEVMYNVQKLRGGWI